MKKLILMGLAIVFSFSACIQQEKHYSQQSLEIDTYSSINDPIIMKEKIIEELGFLEMSKIISDLEELQERTEIISGNLHLKSSERKTNKLSFSNNEANSITFISTKNTR